MRAKTRAERRPTDAARRTMDARQEADANQEQTRQADRKFAPNATKTFTLKVPADMDQKMEAHCFTTLRKKQDRFRDAFRFLLDALKDEEG